MQPMFPIATSPGHLILSLLVHGLFFCVPVVVFSYLAYFFLSLPARRQEQARLFLHVLETCYRDGKPVEQSVISIANTRDRSPGLRFHLTAAYLEEGHSLAAAVEKSRLLPRPIVAMLAAGEHIGDVSKVLPACRRQLQDARSGMSSAINHFMVLVLGLAPLALILILFFSIRVAPLLKEVFLGMSEGMSSWRFDFLMASLRLGAWVEGTLFGLLFLTAILYLCGPGAPWWLRKVALPVLDATAWRVPWKRRRMQRNFAAMLAVLLDANVPEPVALKLAGASAGNTLFQRRAERAAQRLAAGESLTQAVGSLDSAGEFRWRLTNAVHARGGFATALRGWFEGLDARAFQQEQAAAHLLTTGLILVNGLTVGCICAGLFGLLSDLIEAGALW